MEVNYTFEEYYARLSEIWNKIENEELSAMEFMKEYDDHFKLCTQGKEKMIYDANVQLFNSKSSVSEMTEETYMRVSKRMFRIAKFIHRFWIHIKKKDPLDIVAKNAWAENH